MFLTLTILLFSWSIHVLDHQKQDPVAKNAGLVWDPRKGAEILASPFIEGTRINDRFNRDIVAGKKPDARSLSGMVFGYERR
jgi:hypothetical protein